MQTDKSNKLSFAKLIIQVKEYILMFLAHFGARVTHA